MTDRTEHVRNADPFVVGLRFQKVGKVYNFDASEFRDLQSGDFVVVDTSRGRQIGQVIQAIANPDRSSLGTLKPIVRMATPQDLVLRQIWQCKEVEAVSTCREKVLDLGLVDVKIVSAEFSFDGSRLSIMYCSEAGEKTDLRSLRRAIQRIYQQTHVEMHLVGPRDVAKTLGGMGACGLENRCCTAFLTDFSPISIKMAKEQGISLTPTEITGMCGRLRCCLVYEYEQYVEARKLLPKRNKRVITSLGEGRVVDVLPLKQSVIVELEQQGVQREFLGEEIQLLDELETLKKKATTTPRQAEERQEGQANVKNVVGLSKRRKRKKRD
jgi:cell fate regulator YaaT (PSP1 superfamily)